MADGVTLDNGALTDIPVSTDEGGTGKHVQRVKLAYSADGSEVHVPADADGLLVNLGANNDVSILAGGGAVATGAGAVGSSVPRVTHASDDPLVTLSTAANALLTAIKSLLGDSLVTQFWVSFDVTSTQAGAILRTPASGKKIAITHIQVSAYGTAVGDCILFLDDDTTYTAGTDQPFLNATLSPNTVADAESSPGAVVAVSTPLIGATADYSLRLTTTNNLSVKGVIYGYEF